MSRLVFIPFLLVLIGSNCDSPYPIEGLDKLQSLGAERDLCYQAIGEEPCEKFWQESKTRPSFARLQTLQKKLELTGSKLEQCQWAYQAARYAMARLNKITADKFGMEQLDPVGRKTIREHYLPQVWQICKDLT